MSRPNVAKQQDAYLNITQASRFLARLGICRSVWTIRRDVRAGLAHHRFGNRLYFTKADLRQFVARGGR